MPRGIPDEQFIEVVINTKTRAEAAEKLGMSVGGVNARVSNMLKNGKLVSDGHRGVKLPENEDDSEVTENKHSEGEELGSSKATNTVRIDVTPPEAGLRLFKREGVMQRLDTLMSLRDESDTHEIKSLFQQLAIKIFENSLK